VLPFNPAVKTDPYRYALFTISRRRFWFAVCALLVVLRGAALVVDVLDPDEAGHAVHTAVWMDGGVPYVDFIDNKQPLVYAAYRAVFALFGRSLVAVHAVTLPWILATAGFVAALAAAGGAGTAVARVAVVLFILAGSDYIEKDMLSTNTEVLMNLPLAGAFWLLAATSGNASHRAAAAAGLGFGLAVLFNLKAAAAAPALFAALWIPGRRGAGVNTALAVVGAAAPILVALAYFQAHGALDDAWFWNIELNMKYADAGVRLGFATLRRGIVYGYPRLLLFMLATLPLWIAAGAAMREGWRDGRLRPTTLVGALWLAGSLGAACLGGRFYGHYFIPILPPLVWLAAPPLKRLLTEGAPERCRVLRAATLLALVLPVAVFTVLGWIRIAAGDLDGLRPEVAAVAGEVKARTGPGDRIFVWGYWPQLYYYAQRPPATRFVYAQTLAGYVPGHPDSLDPSADTRHYRIDDHWRLWAQDLERHPAELIIDTAPGAIHFWEKYPIADYPPLQELVSGRYRHETSVGGVAIYRLRRDKAGGS
jgi:hypothetical protein